MKLMLRILFFTCCVFAAKSQMQAAAYFIDNFANGIVTDSDGYPGFWTKVTETNQGTLSEDNGGNNMIQFKIGSGNSTNQNASIFSGIDSNFNFFTNAGVMFKFRRIEMTGNASNAHKIAWFDIVSQSGATKNFDGSNDGVRVEITGDGNVRLKFKVNNVVTTKATHFSSNKTPDFIRLNLRKKSNTKVAYELKIYYSKTSTIATKTGEHALTVAKWGNGGNSSMHLTARRQGGSSGTYFLKMTDIYAHDDTAQFSGDLDKQIDFPPPGVSANNAYYKRGLLNVKQAPYNANGNNGSDATAAIQRAIIDAYEYDLACYIPHGTYKISKQLRVMNKITLLDNVITSGGPHIAGSKRKKTSIILGEKMNAAGKRPLLKFDPTKALPAGDSLLHFWSQRYKEGNNVATDNPSDNQGSIGFNIVIKGIDLDVTGQSGAYGLQGAVAQGSSVQDMKIIAHGAEAGIHNMLGVGGGYFNIEIVGGKYGIHVPDSGSETSVYPQIYGLKLINQTNRAIWHNGLGGLVIAGFEIKKNNGPIMQTYKNTNLAPGSISLIDGTIEFTNPNQHEAIRNDNVGNSARSIYLHNVYIKNATYVSRNTNAKGTGWVRVKEYGFTGFNNSNSTECKAIIQRVEKGKSLAVGVDIDYTVSNAEVPDDLVSRHVWNEQAFPSFEDGDAVNALNLGAFGNGVNDDTAVLQAAIANHDKIFLPKGIYMLKSPLVLRKKTQLFGLGVTLSMLRPFNNGTWPVSAPVIKTNNDTQNNFTTTLAFVCINFNKTAKNAGIEWRAGEKSMVRTFHIGQSEAIWGDPVSSNMQFIKVVQGGGGRWWATSPCEAQTALLSGHNNYRLYLVDGTTVPLSFYGMNVERQASEPMSEVRNASNVFIYSYKGENHTGKSYKQTLLQIKNSDNVMLFGYSGIAQSDAGNKQLIKILNSTNVLAANLLPQKKHFNNPGDTVALHIGTSEYKIKYDKGCAILREGNPVLLAHAGGGTPPPPPPPSPPVLAAINDQSVNEGGTLSVGISATDVNGDPITLSASGMPWYGSLTDNGDGTGSITFNPNYQSSGTRTITVTAGDGNGGTDSEVFVLTVNNVNRIPVLAAISDQTVDEGGALTVNISATDADGDPITLSATGLPWYGSLTDDGDGNGSIRFSPNYQSSGTKTISVTADDGSGGSDLETFTLIVNNVNRPPVLAPVNGGPFQVAQNETLTINVSASDPDGDLCTLSVVGVNYATTSMSGNSGTITLNPGNEEPCIHAVTITVDDGNSTANTDTEVIAIEVVAGQSGFIGYENDFSDSSSIGDFTGATGDFTIANGELVPNAPNVWKTMHVNTAIVPDDVDNFKIVTRMKSTGVAGGWEGAAIRFRDINNSDWCALQFRSDASNDIRVFGKSNNSNTTFGEWNTGIDPNTWNTFSIVVRGDQVDIFHGDNFLDSASTPGTSCVINHLTGKVGVRQRSKNAQWDYFRVVALGEPDYIEDFEDNEAQGWNLTSDFQINNGVLQQSVGTQWKFAVYNDVISVDSHYRVSVDGEAGDGRTKSFDSPMLVLKYIDNQNWAYVCIKQVVPAGNRTLRFKSCIGGTLLEEDVLTLTGSSQLQAIDVRDWHNIEAEVKGGEVSVWVNGNLEVDGSNAQNTAATVEITDPVFNENTKCGVRTPTASGGVQFDNFYFFDEYNK